MYKLIALCAVLAVAAAAPSPKPKPGLVYSSGYVPQVVVPAVSSYSGYSNSVVHGSPVVAVPVVQQRYVQPVVHQAVVQPVVHQPLVHQQVVQPVVQGVPVAYAPEVVVA